eukprot:6661415-Prymnesium_polylepis.1
MSGRNHNRIIVIMNSPGCGSGSWPGRTRSAAARPPLSGRAPSASTRAPAAQPPTGPRTGAQRWRRTRSR